MTRTLREGRISSSRLIMEVIMQRVRSTALLLTALTFSSYSFTCTNGKGFLPENGLRIPISEKTSGLTEAQYHSVIDKVEKVYSPIVKSYGALLKIDRKWESDVVNAGTYRDEGAYHLHINLYGGFARHPFITEDGYALVICHELGHHIGGAPKKIINGKKFWASTEGQSDYFATLKCLRKVFAEEDNIAVVSEMNVPDVVREECDHFPAKWERALCIRTSLAGLSVSSVNADSRKVPPPQFETTDTKVVEKTYDAHPVPQCRLDTYFQGSVCEVPSFKTVSQNDETTNTCHESLSHRKGLRPRCWYRSE
jgi:hypothetical protein